MGARRRPRSNRAPVAPTESRIVPRIDRRSVLAFALVLGGLLAPWPGWGQLVSNGFCAYANGLAHTFGVGQAAQQQFTAAGADDDWTVWLSRRDGVDGSSPRASIDVRILGYTPLAVLLALAFATPVPRRRKLVASAVGLAAMLLRLSLVLVLPVGVLGQTYWLVLINPPAMSYLTPVLVWWVALAVTRSSRRSGAA